MDKGILEFLKRSNAKFRLREHPPVRTCGEQAEKAKVPQQAIAKSLIFRTGSGKYILAVGPGNKSLNRRKLQEILKEDRITLATPEEARRIAGCDPGAVHAFGNLMGLETFLDRDLLKNKSIFISPGSLTKTLEISMEDYLRLAGPREIDFEPEKANTGEKETIGITAPKSGFQEWYPEVIQKAGLADYAPVGGCMVIRPYGYAIWEKIQQILDRKLKETGHTNAYFPLFIPEKLLKKEAEHFKGFTPEVAWIEEGNERYALRPTSETIICDSFSKWIRSWRDLPLLINQWCNIIRWETKVTRLFLRTREFLWQEGHTAHATCKEADEEVMGILKIYTHLIEDCLATPVLEGKKSEAEKFAGALYTATMEALMPDGRALQMGTSHNLGQNFSRAFGIKFLDRDGKEKHVWQTSWGISTRLIGALAMVHGDDKGLVLPPRIAPIQIVIVPVTFKESMKEVLKEARALEKSLSGKFSVRLDDRDAYTPGWKYNEWEMKGVPLRIEIGPRDIKKGQAVLVRRDTGNKTPVKLKDLQKAAEKTLDDMQQSLFRKAKKFLQENTGTAKDFQELKSLIENRKMAKAGWCGSPACEAAVKEETGATIRLIPFRTGKSRGRCVRCGKPSRETVYFARAY